MRHSPLTYLLPVLGSLLLVPTAGVAIAAASSSEDGVELPPLVAVLGSDDPCTKASKVTASAVPWEQQSLELTRTWRFGNGSGVKVAVVDTGVSTKAPALAGAVTAVGEAADDCVGHGTFVAGLIAAEQVKGVRSAGVAQGADILAVRGTDERGWATAATIAAGIRRATDAGADVIEVSPAVTERTDGLTSAVAYAASHDALIVAAAVPDGTVRAGTSPAPPRDYWPAAEPGVLSVVGVDRTGRPPQDGLAVRHADLAAPGVGVIGVGPEGTGHFIGSGASLAAAYVAGTAALVRAEYPDLTAAATAERLTATAYLADIPRLDPYASLTSVGANAASPVGKEAQHLPVRLPSAHAGRSTVHQGLLVAAVGGALILVVVWVSVVVPKARARRWHPARRRAVGGGAPQESCRPAAREPEDPDSNDSGSALGVQGATRAAPMRARSQVIARMGRAHGRTTTGGGT
ncbi:S8 family serine peptidase [Streptomyces tendae]|uniref:S8 family serine peptidase n=1 Tax=Streptomyces tendae TaxID=1932 RepID=UPI003D71896F